METDTQTHRHTDTHTQTHKPSTVTLAAHARRGLINHSQAKPKGVLVGVNLTPILLKGFLLAEMSVYNYTHLFENKARAGGETEGEGVLWLKSVWFIFQCTPWVSCVVCQVLCCLISILYPAETISYCS